MPPPATPCRLFVLLARLAPIGLVLRRGPTEWTQLIRWNTRNDTFEPGQWIRGRIDFYKCDLSPSGERLLYFNKAYKPQSVARRYGETWTALSRAPYFTALALWPNSDAYDTSSGGGLFVDDRMIRLNHPSNALATHSKHPARDLSVIAEPMRSSRTSILDERMKRDGWTRGTTQELEKPDPKSRRLLVVRDLSDGILHKRPFRFALIYRNTGEEILAFDGTWADWDQSGQLVYAAEGKLWRADFPPRGRTPEIREIADFNRNRPDPQPSPEWAHYW